MTDKQFSLNAGFSVKEYMEEDDSIIIEGYANTTDLDRAGDIVLEEAWNKGGLSNFMKNPIVLAFHDHTKPIGTIVEHSVDSTGLRVTAKISNAAGNIAKFIKDGILRTFSVSFRIKQADYDEARDIFFVKDLELLEISVVSIPANADSIFSLRKSYGEDTAGYEAFKKEFLNKNIVEPEVNTDESTNTMNQIEETLLNKLNDRIKEQTEELSNAINTAIRPEKKEMPEQVFSKDMVEDLLQQAEERITSKVADENKSLSEALDGLRSDLAEKSAELEALQKNKMSFNDNQGTRVSTKDVDSAILIAKALGRRIEDTKFGKGLIEKAGVGPHLASTTESWEEEFSTRLESDIRERLIMEPLFRTIDMNAATMHIPVNPETGYGEWIARTYPPLRADPGSTGTASDQLISDTVLQAHKLVAKEYLGDEEEEDSILPLMPIVRDAVERRMAKGSDRALLRGDSGVATGDGDTYPFNGVATIGTDASNIVTRSIGSSEKVTVQVCADARRTLGVWGLNPQDLIYVVSKDAYYDLLDDADFRTVDVVGSQATILRGQIGTINGSPVVVSGEFATKASGATAVVVLNPANYIVGNLRNVRVETDRNVEGQRNVLVASRRMGFLDVISGKGAAVVNWAA